MIKVRKRVTLSIGVLLLPLSVFAQCPQFQMNAPDDPQNRTALFLLSLYNKNLAGDGGACVDFSTKDGRVNIGLNDSVFQSGKTELNDPAVYKDKVQKLLQALAITQGDGTSASQQKVLNLDIAGYADGVHRASGSNQDLAESRAEQIKNLLSDDPQVNVTATSGVPSPELEKLYNSNRAKADCANRRKVVISVPIKGNNVQVTANGKFQFTPDTFNTTLSIQASSLVQSAVDNIMEGLTDPPSSAKPNKGNNGGVDSLYESQVKLWQKKNKNLSDDDLTKLKANYLYTALQQGDHPKISKKCDQFPLKQLTLSLLAAKADGTSFSYDEGQAIGQIQSDAKGYFIKDPDSAQTVRLTDLSAGETPTIAYACFTTDTDPDWDQNLSNFDKTTGGNTFKSGSSLVALAQKDGRTVTDQSKFDIGFDPSLMQPEDVTNDPTVPDEMKSRFARDGKPMRGFFCKRCGHGFFFEEVKDASGKVTGYNPVYDDRAVRSTGNASTDPLVKALNNLTSDNPAVLGTSLKPMVYVVSGCPACNCNPMQKIRSKSSSVTTIDPLAMGSSGGATMDFDTSGVQDLNTKCVVRPPVWHTCGASPNVVPPNQSKTFEGLLSYKSPVDNSVYQGLDFNQLVANVSNGCSQSNLTPQQKVNSVCCSTNAASRLPSSDVAVDCPNAFPSSQKAR